MFLPARLRPCRRTRATVPRLVINRIWARGPEKGARGPGLPDGRGLAQRAGRPRARPLARRPEHQAPLGRRSRRAHPGGRGYRRTARRRSAVHRAHVPRPVPRSRGGRPRTCPDHVVADRAYSSCEIRPYLCRRAITHTIPERRDQAQHRRRRGSEAAPRRRDTLRQACRPLRSDRPTRSDTAVPVTPFQTRPRRARTPPALPADPRAAPPVPPVRRTGWCAPPAAARPHAGWSGSSGRSSLPCGS